MSEYQPEYQPTPGFEQSPPHTSRTWLWVVLIGGAVCLILAIIIAAVAGLGWLVYGQVQTDNATAAAQSVADLPPPGWSSSMDDRFASNQNDWLVGSFDDDYGDAELAIEEGLYRWMVEPATDDGVFWWGYPEFDHDLDDFYLSVDGRLDDGDRASADYGLIFRFVDEDNFYFFAISDDQYLTVELLQDDQWILLLDWTETSLVRPGETNHLAVLVEETHYKFYINGELAYELDDDRLTGGTIGLGADVWDVEGATFEFDNLQVYEP
jgi:hypothetical protein